MVLLSSSISLIYFCLVVQVGSFLLFCLQVHEFFVPSTLLFNPYIKFFILVILFFSSKISIWFFFTSSVSLFVTMPLLKLSIVSLVLSMFIIVH